MRAERRFRAMGTDVHVLAVDAAPGALDAAVARVHDLEARWSRFRADSELRRLNGSGGRPVVVSEETAAAVAAAVDAWRRTGGRFDPTVGPALRRCGYDRSFEDVPRDGRRPDCAEPAPGCHGIVVDAATHLVWLPPGVELDLGGIGKGLAADRVAEQLVEAGAAGAAVDVGGDVSVVGEAGVDAGWVVAVEHPGAGEVARLALDVGGVATTSTRRRRWRRGGAWQHHVIDPRTGAPAAGDLAGVSVVAGSAAAAEVLCKAVLLAAPHEREQLVTAERAAAVAVDRAGLTTWLGFGERAA